MYLVWKSELRTSITLDSIYKTLFRNPVKSRNMPAEKITPSKNISSFLQKSEKYVIKLPYLLHQFENKFFVLLVSALRQKSDVHQRKFSLSIYGLKNDYELFQF